MIPPVSDPWAQCEELPEWAALAEAMRDLLYASPAEWIGGHSMSISLVLADRPAVECDQPPSSMPAFLAVKARALIAHRRNDEARAMADEARLVVARAVLSGADPIHLARCVTLLADVHLSLGETSTSARLAAKALAMNPGSRDRDAAHVAQAILAVSLALNGQLDAADAAYRATIALADPAGTRTVTWMSALSGLGDDSLCPEAPVTGSIGDRQNSSALLLSARRSCEQRAYRSALAQVDSLLHRLQVSYFPPVFMATALAIRATACLQLGQPRDVLRGLVGFPEIPGHAVCGGILQVAAQLQLGEPAEALKVADRCIQMPSHSLLSLPMLHAGRAAALELQGLPQHADAAFSQGLYLAYEAGLVQFPIGFPHPLVHALFARFSEAEPEFAAVIAEASPPRAIRPRSRQGCSPSV